MKRKLLSLTLALSLCAALALPAMAQGEDEYSLGLTPQEVIAVYEKAEIPAQDENGCAYGGRLYLDFDQDGIPEMLTYYTDGHDLSAAYVYRVTDDLSGELPEPYLADLCGAYPDALVEEGDWGMDGLQSFMNAAGWGTTGSLIRFSDGQYGLLSDYSMRFGPAIEDFERQTQAARFQNVWWGLSCYFVGTDETDYEVVQDLGVYAQLPADSMTFLSGAAPMAYASTQTVTVNGAPVEFQMYALKDEKGYATNYVKVRDVAQTLNGTAGQFSVTWDGAVNLVPGGAYTPNGSEMKTPYSGDRAYQPASAPTKVNGVEAALEAIVLTDDAGGGYTYYKLRDLGTALGFTVDWSAERGVFIETGSVPAPTTTPVPANDLVGTWLATVEMAETVNAGFAEEPEMAAYFHVDTFPVGLAFDLCADGTYTLSIDETSTNASIEALKPQFREGLRAYLTDLLAKEGLGGVGLDLALAMVGIDLDAELEDLFTEMKAGLTSKEYTLSGRYQAAEPGKLLISMDPAVEPDGSDYLTYEWQGSALYITGENKPSGTSLFPLTFVRK